MVCKLVLVLPCVLLAEAQLVQACVTLVLVAGTFGVSKYSTPFLSRLADASDQARMMVLLTMMILLTAPPPMPVGPGGQRVSTVVSQCNTVFRDGLPPTSCARARVSSASRSHSSPSRSARARPRGAHASRS